MFEASKSNQIRIAAAIGGAWLLLILIFWLALGGLGGGEEPIDFAAFLGRFHILIVHVPIGLLCVAFIMEVMARFEMFKKANENVVTLLWFGVLGAIAATAAGYLLMVGEQFAGNMMKWHLWTGLGVVVLAIGSLVLKIVGKYYQVYLGTLLANVFLISASSHYGGNMVHTEEYLTEKAPDSIRPTLEFLMGHSSHEEGEKAADINEWAIYDDIIQPIFNEKCTECHDENKIKGDLRMDTFEWLQKGGEMVEAGDIDGEWVPGDAEDSELYFRVTIEPEDDLFMPPGDREHMTEDEIALMAWWINEGGTKELTVGEAKKDDNIKRILEELKVKSHESASAPELAPKTWVELDETERAARITAAKDAAAEIGFSLLPISEEDARFQVNVKNCAASFGDAELARLEPIAGQIAWLDLGRSQITDVGMRTVAKMNGLERLHLEEVAVTDAGIAKIAHLTELTYLNLYATQITDASLPHFSGLQRLQKLFVWQTGVTPQAARDFQRRMSLEVNTGWTVSATSEPQPANPE